MPVQPEPVLPKRILVVEDDLVAAQTIRTVLVMESHLVQIAENAEDALSLFMVGDYDLVITDFKLPGMDGLELAEAIKQQAPSKPVILVTAYAEKLESAMGKVSNVDRVLKKPFSVAELKAALKDILPTMHAF